MNLCVLFVILLLAIFGDRSYRPKSPGVPGGAITIFA